MRSVTDDGHHKFDTASTEEKSRGRLILKLPILVTGIRVVKCTKCIYRNMYLHNLGYHAKKLNKTDDARNRQFKGKKKPKYAESLVNSLVEHPSSRHRLRERSQCPSVTMGRNLHALLLDGKAYIRHFISVVIFKSNVNFFFQTHFQTRNYFAIIVH